MSSDGEILRARHVLRVEAHGISKLADALGEEFVAAVDAIEKARLVHIAGVGKSGDIGRKIAATMRSQGTQAVFLDPTGAVHGDLGLVLPGDVVILISRSGACREIGTLTAHLWATNIRTEWKPGVEAYTLIALTGAPDSDFADRCDIVIDCSVPAEADDDGLVPTASTAATMAVGDALSDALARRAGWTSAKFRAVHPG